MTAKPGFTWLAKQVAPGFTRFRLVCATQPQPQQQQRQQQFGEQAGTVATDAVSTTTAAAAAPAEVPAAETALAGAAFTTSASVTPGRAGAAAATGGASSLSPPSQRLAPASTATAASWATVLSLATQPSFRASLAHCLTARCEAPAFFFECRPVRRDVLATTPFEFVLSRAPILVGVHSDPYPFRKQLAEAQRVGVLATAFPNLGRNAVLVCPSGLRGAPAAAAATSNAPASNTARNAEDKNAHLAAFLRGSAADEVDAFWRETFAQLGKELEARAARDPAQWTWLSTHGGGVSWLHMRIDLVPKYYHFRPYKTPPQ